MAVTLAQFKLSTTNSIVQGIISEILADSALFNVMPFDECVSPTGGSSMDYVYTREKTGTTAAFRALNAEYTPSEATVEKVTTELAILGGSFQIDRVTARATSGSRIVDQMEYQLADKRRAIVTAFYNCLVNGDTGTDQNAFDGLVKAIGAGSQTFDAGIDVSTSGHLDVNAMAFADAMDALLAKVPGANFILCNDVMKTKLAGIARRLGIYQLTKYDAGAQVDTWNGIPFMDMGYFGADKIIPVSNKETTIFAVRIAMDGLHGLTLDGGPLIDAFLPDLEEPGAVKKGEAEMVCGLALKKVKAAGSMSGITVEGTSGVTAPPKVFNIGNWPETQSVNIANASLPVVTPEEAALDVHVTNDHIPNSPPTP